MARGEAVKRKAPVLICRSGDPEAAIPVCGGDPNTWSFGWLVFASADGNNGYDAGVDILIRVHAPSCDDLDIRSNALARTGRHCAVCDDREESFGRQLNIAAVGQASIDKGYPGNPINGRR